MIEQANSSRRPQFWDESHVKTRIRMRASNFVRKNGIRKRPCICGKTNVQMHHPDYSEPLKVAFLCARCHRRHHTGLLTVPFEVHDLRELVYRPPVNNALSADSRLDEINFIGG